MVPLPRFASWEDFNAWLEAQCRKRQAEILRGHAETIGERLARDLEAMADLPAAPFDACDQATGRVSSQALVRYKTNDYSVPVAYGHRDVWVRGYVDQVVIGCGGEIIARHPRCYDREDMVFDPVHYLPLIEKKINALDQAAPLAEWDLPAEFQTLRRLMEARMIKAGRREYVQVLRLLEAFEHGRPACRGEDRAAHGRRRLRRHQASGAVPGREAPAEARPRRLPLSAARHRRQDLGGQLHVPGVGDCGMTDAPEILLAHHLKTLKLPTFLREYDKLARQCAAEGLDHVRFLARLVELELIDRERRMIERRIKAARFPAVKSLDSFDFKAIPALNKMQVLELARCEWIERRENVIALGPSGTGKTHVALGLGLAACQKGLSVGFTTAAALVHELMEARDERRLLRLQKQMAGHKLLIIDELGFVPLSKTGAELLFELISPALRARRHPDHQQSALRRMDRDLRLRAPYRRAARPADPPRHHPRDERRQLSPRPEPHAKDRGRSLTPAPIGPTGQSALAHASYSRARGQGAHPAQTSFPASRSGRVLRRPVAGFSTAVDTLIESDAAARSAISCVWPEANCQYVKPRRGASRPSATLRATALPRRSIRVVGGQTGIAIPKLISKSTTKADLEFF